MPQRMLTMALMALLTLGAVACGKDNPAPEDNPSQEQKTLSLANTQWYGYEEQHEHYYGSEMWIYLDVSATFDSDTSGSVKVDYFIEMDSYQIGDQLENKVSYTLDNDGKGVFTSLDKRDDELAWTTMPFTYNTATQQIKVTLTNQTLKMYGFSTLTLQRDE